MFLQPQSIKFPPNKFYINCCSVLIANCKQKKIYFYSSIKTKFSHFLSRIFLHTKSFPNLLLLLWLFVFVTIELQYDRREDRKKGKEGINSCDTDWRLVSHKSDET